MKVGTVAITSPPVSQTYVVVELFAEYLVVFDQGVTQGPPPI
jgi:hypothetical protein